MWGIMGARHATSCTKVPSKSFDHLPDVTVYLAMDLGVHNVNVPLPCETGMAGVASIGC